MKLQNKKHLLGGPINFISIVEFNDIPYNRFYDTLEDRAEAIEATEPGTGYQRVYHEMMSEVFSDMVSKIATGKTVLVSYKDVIEHFDDMIMKPYLKEREKQNIPIDVKLCDNAEIKRKTLENFNDILASGVTSALDATKAMIAAGQLTLDDTIAYMNSKQNKTPTKGEALTLTSYAMALKEINKDRSFFDMLRNLRIHFREKSAIKKMRMLASQHSKIENLEVEARDGNPKIIDLRFKLAEALEAANNEHARTDDIEIELIPGEKSEEIDVSNILDVSELKREEDIFDDNFNLYEIDSEDIKEEDIAGRSANYDLVDPDEIGDNEPSEPENEANIANDDAISEFDGIIKDAGTGAQEFDDDEISVIDGDNIEKGIDGVRESIDADKLFADLNSESPIESERISISDLPKARANTIN